MIEVITLSEGFIVSEIADESQVLEEIKQEHPAAFSMYLETSNSQKSSSELTH